MNTNQFVYFTAMNISLSFLLLWLSNDMMKKQKPLKLLIVLIMCHIVSYMFICNCFTVSEDNILDAKLLCDI